MMVKAGLIPLLISYVIALVFTVMPMPAVLEPWRPDWVSLVLIYWLMAVPHRVGVGTVLIVGLLTDILLGSTFGVYASALLLISYPVLRHYQRIRHYALVQQALVVAILIFFKRVIVYEIEHVLNDAVFSMPYLYPVVSSALIWPWVFLALRRYRRHNHIH